MHRQSIDRREFLALSLKAAGTAAIISCIPGIDCAMAKGRKIIDSFQSDSSELQEVLEIATGSGADFADIFLEQTLSRKIRLTDGKAEIIETQLKEGVGIRIVTDGRTWFSSNDGFLRKDVRSQARQLRKNVKKRAKSKPTNPPRRPVMDTGVIIARKKLDRYSSSDIIHSLTSLYDGISKSSNLISDLSIDYYDEIRRIIVANTNGSYITDTQPLIDINLNCAAQQGAARTSGKSRVSHRCGFEMLTDSSLETSFFETVTRTVESLAAKPVNSGSMPITLQPRAAAWLTSHFVNLLSKRNFDGKDIRIPLSIKLFDNGRIVNGRGSSHFDDEGVRTSETKLFDNGKFIDSINCREHFSGRALSGNGRRTDYRRQPIICPTNTFIKVAEYMNHSADILPEMGLLVTDAVPVESPDKPELFQLKVLSGYLCLDHRQLHPVKNVIISGLFNDILSRITSAGEDLVFIATAFQDSGIPISYGAPRLSIASMNVRQE